MKLGLFGLATVATLALGAGTVSAQYRYYPVYVPRLAPRVVVTASAPVVVTPAPVVAGSTVVAEPTVTLAGQPVLTVNTEFVPVFEPVYVPYRTYYPYYYHHYRR